jgi:formate hydrogenlyase subunit 3/multisubunit Na+/H+ antiporter MnhD subunit
MAWDVPYGAFYVEIDALSAVFLLALFIISPLAAIYGASGFHRQRRRVGPGASWLFFNLLVSSMALLVIARNGILFLFAWEVMAIASFFLVVADHEKAEVRNAGWTYLVAAHVGTAFLLTFFSLLGREADSLDFDRFAVIGATVPSTTATLVFLLAVVGFGVKAGFVPFHIWLPQAHPVAPSHVSALMSGVMIKMGVYGILRTLTFFETPPAWWGIALVVVGLASGLLAALMALSERDLKRLLAYSSIENVGIIGLAMGIGLWGLSMGSSVVALLGFAGALLHVLNHAVFKGLLFLSAGAVVNATREHDIDHLGGLLRRMPRTGVAFLVGAAAIVGLPPLGGFASEFLVVLSSLKALGLQDATIVTPLAVIVGLGAIGGLAAAFFTKAFGLTFLGSPRSSRAARAHEGPRATTGAMLVLAALCVAMGIASPLAVRVILPAAASLSGVTVEEAAAQTMTNVPLDSILRGTLILAATLLALALLRRFLLSSREVRTAVTWDCGYERPSVRMQYTASSFAQPLMAVFRPLMRTRTRIVPPRSYFPRRATFASETPDFFTRRVYGPTLAWIEWSSGKLRWLQHGRVHLYLLYIFLTLLVLLVWELGLSGRAP